MSRRTFLGGAALSVAIAQAEAATQGGKSLIERMGLPIGLQMYTLGSEAGQDLDATFIRLSEIGYRSVELPSLLGHPAKAIKSAADRAGIAIGSLHLPLLVKGGASLSLASDATRIVETLGELGAGWVVAPMMLIPEGLRPLPGEQFGSAMARAIAAKPELWRRTAELLNERGAALKPVGVRLAYHNHNLEFAAVGGSTGWDTLWRETDPGLVHFEVDTGWVATAGLDPVSFLKKCAGRVALMHVKDVARDNLKNFALTMKPSDVGSGMLRWDQILPAAYEAGVRHFYVEQEPPFTISRIEAAKRSFEFLARL